MHFPFPKLFLLCLPIVSGAYAEIPTPPVQIYKADGFLVLENGFLKLSFHQQTGQVASIHTRKQGEMICFSSQESRNALYLDWNASPTLPPSESDSKQPRAGYGHPRSANFCILENGPDVAELTFHSPPRPWAPFACEIHYRMPRNQRMVYIWVEITHDSGMPAGSIGQTRLVFRGLTGSQLFTHSIIDRDRIEKFTTSPIVETIQDATYRHADGAVHTKYDNSAFTHDYLAHGLWGHGLGCWFLWPSTEFCNGGPMRQDLTVHRDNVLLAMFQSGHFGAAGIEFNEKEDWSKLFGPVVFYVNDADSEQVAFADAAKQAQQEKANWPYVWLQNDGYSLERTIVNGEVEISNGTPSTGAWVILSPVEQADYALSSKGYQFWSRVKQDGSFTISNVRPGKYKLNCSGADQPNDFQQIVEIDGKTTSLGTLNWEVDRNGKCLWQVGRFDRQTTEFDGGKNPRSYLKFINYFENYPEDVVFEIGTSREKNDWFYAQWDWYKKTPKRSIRFHSDRQYSGDATLTIGFASCDIGKRTLVIRLNGKVLQRLRLPKTGAAGYRSGSQDSRYVLEIIKFDAGLIKNGKNDLSFEISKSQPYPKNEAELGHRKRPRGSVMYDAIRMEVDWFHL